jgi:hypothetical protein
MCAALFTGNVVLILVLAAALNADQVFQLPTAVVTECLQAVFHQALHPKLSCLTETITTTNYFILNQVG